MAHSYLDKAYGTRGVAATRALYDGWSASYDDEISSAGYATPGRIAAVLAANASPETVILDFGCGTGLSGAALAMRGFATIDGCDLSAPMLEQARVRGCYRRLWQHDPDTAQPTEGGYGAVVACGVVSSGAAPPETLDSLAALLAPGGLLAFSFNDHALADPAYPARAEALLANGFRQLHREHGPHLPGIGLQATVYLLQRV